MRGIPLTTAQILLWADEHQQRSGELPNVTSGPISGTNEIWCNLDAAMRKEFSVKERAHLQIRFEAFNVVNHTRFGLPNNFYGDPLFGNVNSLAPGFTPRRVQIVARVEF